MLEEALDEKLCLKRRQINAMFLAALEKKLCLEWRDKKSCAWSGVRQKALLRAV